MKKRLTFLSALLAVALCASASGKWTLQSKDYNVDTVFHAKIGPGTTQTSLSLSGGSTLKIFYITVDLTDPYVDVRVAQAGSKLTGGAKLSAMSNANTDASTGIQYFAGVNADFFGGNQPIGASVVNSQVYKAPASSDWVSWYMNDSKIPGIEKLKFTGTATAGTATHAVSAINDGRATDFLVVYNDHYAATTGTNSYGTEVVISCDKPISYNGTYTCTVESAPVGGVGSMTIPAGKYVLSGHGTASTFVSNLKAGDTVTLDLTTKLATGGCVTQLAGGQPIILQDGVTLDTQNALDHLTALNPRTAVGYSSDRTKLVLLVVDGRGMGGSAGVVSKVLADIMRCVGCADAMNFDGGGSSELYTRIFGVRNKPSDGNERTVVNSVWAVATAPADNNIAELAFTTPTLVLPKYGYYEPVFYTYNQYGVMLAADFKGAELSCPPELGVIVDGKTLFANGSGTHKLTATYNGVSTDILVTVGTADPRARLEKVIVDGFRDYKVEVVATVEGQDMAIDNQAFDWSSADPSIATVDADGIVRGLKTGQTIVTATVDGKSFTLPVEVQKPAGRYIDINADGDLTKWELGKSGVSTDPLATLGKGFSIDYKISSTRSPSFTLKISEKEGLPLYALPDSIRIVINPGTAKINKIILTAGVKGERGTTSTKDITLAQNQNNILLFPISDFCDTDDMGNYPVTFNQIQFYVSGSAGESAHVEIPTFTTVHTALTETDGVDAILPDTKPGSSKAAINKTCVKRGETVETTAAGWTLYNMSGAIQTQGSGTTIATANLQPGVYVVVAGEAATRLVIL